MTDTPNDSNPAPEEKSSVNFAPLKKLAVMFAAIMLLWVAFTQLAPKFLFPHAAAPVVETASEPLPPEDRPEPMGDTPPPPPPPPPPQNDPQLMQRIDALETRLQTLEEATKNVPKNAVSSETVEALAGRLSEIENRTLKKLQLQSVFAQLKERASRGEAFAAQQETLDSLLDGNEHVKALQPLAATGAPTLSQLRERFSEKLSLALFESEDKRSLKANLNSLIRIRKVGADQQGNSKEAILARAEAKLASSKLDGCLEELAELPKPEAEIFAEWVHEATARLQLDAQVAALEANLP